MGRFLKGRARDLLFFFFFSSGLVWCLAVPADLFSQDTAGEENVEALVQFRGDPSNLERMGIKVRGVVGDVASVQFPLSAAKAVSGFPQVVRMRPARRLRPLLDRSVPATGARDVVWRRTTGFEGNTGQNVVIGIIDSGLDLQHPDFRRSDGESRVLFLWDQAQSGFLRFPPQGFGYGMECVRSAITLGGCPEADDLGHGTHVAGIAAGNGSATGNGQNAYRYIGMAPEADLIVVKTDFFESHILDGISFIREKAALLGKPYVINLSLGSHIDSHDGTSLLARALDNASGPGKVIVASMGNEARSRNHAVGTVPQDGSVSVPFSVPISPVDVPLAISIWYSGADRLKITVTDPKSCSVALDAPAGPGDRTTADAPCAPITLGSFPEAQVNGDREALILLGNGLRPPAAGNWTLQFEGSEVASGRFDAWTEDATFLGALQTASGSPTPPVGTVLVDPGSTLVDTATAREVISVGSYVTRRNWPTLAGGLSPTTATAGEGSLSSFSSLGPRRACSLLTACPPVQKPDLVAPGEWVVSSRSAQYDGSACASNLSPAVCLEADGVHTVLRGTSMSAPHVAGAVALILQWHPEYTPDQVKQLLFSSVQSPAGGASPSFPAPNAWGEGILDIGAAMAVLAATAAPPAPAPPEALAVTPGDRTLNLTWTPPSILHVQGYNVYRSLTAGSDFEKVNPTPVRAERFTDTGLENGTVYYYVVTTVDTFVNPSEDPPSVSGRESAEFSNEASGAPSPSSNGGECLITRLYGSPDDPHLASLRRIRDQIKERVPGGAWMVREYYRTGPRLWEGIKQSVFLRNLALLGLNLVLFLWEAGFSWGWGIAAAFLLLFAFWIKGRRAAIYGVNPC